MNRKQVNDFTKVTLVVLLVFFSVWIIFEVADAQQEKPSAERLPVDMPTDTVCFGNPEGEEYVIMDCDQVQAYNE